MPVELPIQGATRSRSRRRRANGNERATLDALEKRSTTISSWLLVLMVVGSVLAMGGVHLPVVVTIGAVATAAATLVLSSWELPCIPWVAVILAVLSGYCVLQAVPLPFGVLEAVAPANAEVWAGALQPFGEATLAAAAVSLDPGASAVEAVKWFSYAAVFVTAGHVAARRGARWGAAVLMLSAVALAITTIVHGLVGAEKVYGFYAPRHGGVRWHVAPLVNSNNLSGYLNVGLLCGLGLIASKKPPLPRWLVGICVAFVLGVAAVSGSRGGALALVVGGLVFALGYFFLVRTSPGVGNSPASTARALALVGVVGLLFALAAGNDSTLKSLFDANVEKLALARSVWPMVVDHAALGIGRGAFQSVFPAYLVGPNNLIFSHAENFPLQWGAEWGLPVTLVALAGLAFALRPRMAGTLRSPAGIGVGAAVFALIIQNFVDLGLEVASIAIAASAALGTAWGGGLRGRRPRSVPQGRRRAVRMMVPSAGLVLLGFAVSSGAHSLEDDRDRVHDLYLQALGSAQRDVSLLRGALRGAMLRHPAEPYFARVGAAMAWKLDRTNPMPWLQRALERSLYAGRTHLLLAGILAERGVNHQARLELRLALEGDPALSKRAAAVAVQLDSTFEKLVQTVPAGKGGAVPLTAIAELLAEPRDRQTRLACLREAVHRNPNFVQAHVMLILTLFQRLRDGDQCGEKRRQSCLSELDDAIEYLARNAPNESRIVEFRGRLLLESDRSTEATRYLSVHCPQLSERRSCLRLWARAAATTRDPALIRNAALSAELDGCTTHERCADTFTSLAQAATEVGALELALEFTKRAAEEEPTRKRRAQVAQAIKDLARSKR